MNFEEKSNNYINQLVAERVMIDAALIGVNEEHKTSTAIAKFLVNDVVEEKHIFIYEVNEILTWKYLILANPITE